MAVKATTVPFSGGQDSTVDKHLAGLGKLRTAINARLDADGRIVVRAGYTALGVTTYGVGNHVAYDLFELDGRLCSLGDRRGDGHATDVFEFVEGGAATWKPTAPTGSVADVPPLPRGTRLVELGRPPDQRGGVSSFDVAALGGFVLLAYNDDGTPPLGAVMLMRAGSGQILLATSFDGGTSDPRFTLQTIALTSRFWVVGLTTATTDVTARRIDPATDEAFVIGHVTLLNNAGGFSIIAAERVTGIDQFVVASVSAAGALVVRRFDSAGGLLVPSGGQYATIAGLTANYLAVEADTTANQLTVAVVDGNTLKLYSWNLATGAQIGAPPFTPAEVVGETCQNVALVRADVSRVRVLVSVSSIGTPDVKRVLQWRYTVSVGTFTAAVTTMGTALASGAIYISNNDTLVFGVTTDDNATTPNMLLEQGSSTDLFGVVAAKDLGFASPPLAGIPKFASDLSRTPPRYYWVHGVQSADGNSIPVVCELCLTDSGRRQIARVGRGVVISGAMPVTYDGVELVELGMVERPVIVSLTPSVSTGELESAATYSYIATRRWFDTLGRLHRSPISLPVDVTMGASDNTIAAVVSGAHTARHSRYSAPLGSVVCTELYRTRAIVTKTQPTVTGDQNASPPIGVLNGSQLFIFTFDISGGASATVTFGAGATTIAAVLAAINAVAAGRYIATNAAGGVAITSLGTGGAFDYVQINGTASALSILGFTDGQSANGTTEIDRGDVFHLTTSTYSTVGGIPGDRVALTDIRDDDADSAGLQSQAVLYTQLESPLDDHSPLPSDRVWSGLERLEVAGHPQRATWTSSKQLEQGFAPAFADQGQPGFSGELVESIEAVITQQRSKLYLTRKGIWQVDGAGPALNGQGSFSRANRVFSDGGLVADGWRSLLETAQGTWMQLGSDKLYLMPAGGAPVWAGFPIRELLRTYPVIVAATLTGNDQLAAFALQTTAGTSGRIALYDLRRGVWFVDDVGVTPVALADYGGRLCFADTSGIVYMQDTAAGSGTFVPLTLATAYATIFGVSGQGAAPRVYVVGQWLGDCTLQLLVDYDDGVGFVTAGTFALTAANGYATGKTVREEFELAVEDCSQFALEVLVTGTNGSAGLAVVAFEVHAERDAGPALLGDSFRR